jgi:acetylornithine deacetylase/succinyl-diaminopimelate desuccinylase-like protein
MTPVELLQQLIRFDTTNPPGNEAECVGFVRGLLDEAGCETQAYV